MRFSILALFAVGCTLHDQPLAATPPAGDASLDATVPTRDAAPPPDDASTDAGHCEVDVDHDGSCAGEDCDDLNPRRSPRRTEYCPDRVDNDCDDRVDFDDDCAAVNDVCDGPLTLLVQDPDIDPSVWVFVLPLSRYGDDMAAGLSAGGGDCTGSSGQGGNDAVFQLTAQTDAQVSVTASGLDGAVPVLILRSVCGQGQASDLCDVADIAPASLSGQLEARQTVWLIVDESTGLSGGVVHVEIRIQKRTDL